MALGAAFIEVHADTKPFARELGRELNKILQAAEKDVKNSATKVGHSISDGVNDGVNKGVKDNSKKLSKTLTDGVSKVFGQDLGKKFSIGIIDSLDDGLSGLPAEVKVALGAAVAAILPFLGAAISGALGAALAVGFAGLGVLAASQFQSIQDQFTLLTQDLRTLFVNAASPFVEPLLAAFTTIRTTLNDLEGWFQEVFAASAKYIAPLTAAFTGFAQGLLPGLLDTLRNIQPIVDQLSGAFNELGRTIGRALTIISGSEYADEGFHDLVVVLEVLILSGAVFIRVLTEIYGYLRDISLLLSGPRGWAQFFAGNAAQDQAEHLRALASANGEFTSGLDPLIAKTEEEQRALEGVNRQLQQLNQLMFSAKNNEIAFEEGLDNLTASVKENGRSLKIQDEAGRANAQTLLNLAQVAIKTREETIALTGKTAEAQTKFEQQRATIYNLAKQLGLSASETENLVGELLRIPPPKESGVTQGTINRLLNAVRLAKSLGQALGSAVAIGIQAAGIQAHAKGGVFSTPHVGLVAEAGPEAIIPLNNPGRAAEVMAEAGLGSMMSPTVNVYIGNQQIDAYIDARVSQSNAVTARSLTYGSRGI
jgi:hypothetical protein